MLEQLSRTDWYSFGLTFSSLTKSVSVESTVNFTARLPLRFSLTMPQPVASRTGTASRETSLMLSVVRESGAQRNGGAIAHPGQRPGVQPKRSSVMAVITSHASRLSTNPARTMSAIRTRPVP
jgi:hypothetical protein